METEPSVGIQLIGHLSYVLLVSASLVRAILPLRLLAIAAGTTSVIYGVAMHSTADVFWEGLFTAINAVQAVILVREQRSIRLSDEEKSLHAEVFPEMSRLDFHRFIRAGKWHSDKPGHEFTYRGQPVDRIVLLSEGTAEVIVDEKIVGHCRRGDFIGEIAFVTGNAATASVRTAGETRSLAWKFSDLRKLIEKHPEVRAALQLVFNQNLIVKLNEQRDRRKSE